MKVEIPFNSLGLNANVFINEKSKKCVLFLCGGSLDVGKERFLSWQRDLEKINVSSVAFDYVGVPGTRAAVSDSSLESRIEEVMAVMSWVKSEIKPTELIVYGVSMGGYIALGATALSLDAIIKLVLHAPAAYAKTAQELLFDTSFTDVISQSESWNNSLSFSWLEQFNNPVLFFQPEFDEVIPSKVTECYLSIGNKKTNFTHVCLHGAGHKCWDNSESNNTVRKEIFKELVGFIRST